jgi:hypothetical protein
MVFKALKELSCTPLALGRLMLKRIYIYIEKLKSK